MVRYAAMSMSARAQVINSVETDEPEVLARQRHLVELLFAKVASSAVEALGLTRQA
jgi:hypothetical protein